MGSASEAAWRIGIPGHHGIVQQDEEIDSRVMDFFDRQWSSYRAIVEHDLMEHHQKQTWTQRLDQPGASRMNRLPSTHGLL
ncbi:hypothetical protein [Cyanobium sp. BA5m-10]|uniref:hypothetical protein n=1 Tax=Cyanobium sp. BA5m-10 TaxID=2823705 RepID=UPI0020CBD360|nr:hypothetical protein [Cyanobium sp. BA5m-10]